MPISNAIQTAPGEIIGIAHKALRRRVRGGGSPDIQRGLAQIGLPLPVYRIALLHVRSENPVRFARLHSWEAPALIGDRPALLHFRHQSVGWRFCGITDGRLAERLFTASALAEEALANDDVVWRPRVLEIPALRLACLWLRGSRGQDLAVVLTDPAWSSENIKLESSLENTIQAWLQRSTLGRAVEPRLQ
jgi:hypothetical protein